MVRSRRREAWAPYLAPRTPVIMLIVAGLAVGRAWVSGGWLAEAMSVGLQLAALVAVTGAARGRDARDPMPWSLLAAGLGLLFAAELYWSWLQLTDPDAFPSPADYLSAAGLTLIGLALWRCATRVSPAGDRAGFVDAAAVALAASTLAWVFIVEPAGSTAGRTSTEQIWVILSLTLDVGLLTMAARLAFALKVRPPAYLYLYLAIGGSMLVDVLDSMLEVGLGSEVGRAEDVIFLACSGFWVMAALHRGPVPKTPASRLHHLGTRRLVVLIAASSVPLAAIAVKSLRGEQLGPITTLAVGISGLVLAGLVAVRIASIVGVVRELAVVQGRERFAAMVEHASDVILTIDEAQRITYASPSVTPAWGYESVALIGRPISDLFVEQDATMAEAQLVRAAALPDRSKLTLELRVKRNGIGTRTCEVVAANLTNHPGVGGISLTLRDITAQRSLETELRQRAFNDDLTGLANRALFMDRVAHALERHSDGATSTALLSLDLDDFTHVNDGLGHAAGDEVLVAVGERLVSCVQPGDTVARLGGDEFGILLEDRGSVEEVTQVTAHLLEVLALPLRAGELDLSVRATVGIALAEPGTDAGGLLRDSDIAMYEAKGSARSRWVVFDSHMRTAAVGRISLRSDLEQALAGDQLHLVYQPIFSLVDGTTLSAEALLRWEHPTRGSVSPAEFVPIAEQSGQITAIGAWVLEQACEAAARWSRCGRPIGVSVNVSAVQFQGPAFVGLVHDALRVSGIAPQQLTIEVTETAMMFDPDATAAMLLELRSLGTKVAIDDFGTGYCSLAYLRRFSFDSLKIDQAFVSEIRPPASNLLVHNILRLAESLGVPAVAEGIEHEVQMEDLRRHQCAFGQGFHLARPMPSEDFERLLAVGDDASTPGGLHLATVR